MKNLPVSSQRKRAILKLRDLISFILNYVPNNVTRTSYSHDTYFKKKERKAWSCQEMLDGTIERYRGFNPPDRRKRVFERLWKGFLHGWDSRWILKRPVGQTKGDKTV